MCEVRVQKEMWMDRGDGKESFYLPSSFLSLMLLIYAVKWMRR